MITWSFTSDTTTLSPITCYTAAWNCGHSADPKRRLISQDLRHEPPSKEATVPWIRDATTVLILDSGASCAQ